jgi:chromosome partitioning protein
MCQGRFISNTRKDVTRICFINQKGGCGKSSSCFHLAGAFAQLGHRVLLVDMDPQGSLSQGFFGSSAIENLSAADTVTALFDENHFFVDRQTLCVPTPIKESKAPSPPAPLPEGPEGEGSIDIVRSNQTLAAFNIPSPEKLGMEQFALREFFTEVSEYDLVLIDCPPNLYQCSWNAMLAADRVVIPVPPEDFGTQGLRVVHQAIEHARQLNPHLELLGHLVTRFDGRLLVHQSYEAKLRTLYGATVLDTVVPETSAYKVALACRLPVNQYNPKVKAAKLTTTLAGELLTRIESQNLKRSVG